MSIGHFANASSAAESGDPPPPADGFVAAVTALAPINWYRLNETTGSDTIDSGTVPVDLEYSVPVTTLDFDQPPSSSFTGAGARSKLFDNEYAFSNTKGAIGQIASVSTFEFAIDYGAGNSGRVASRLTILDNDRQWHITLQGSTMRFAIYDLVGGFIQFDIIPDMLPIAGSWAYISITYNSVTDLVETNINGVYHSNLDTSSAPLNNPAGCEFGLAGDANGGQDLNGTTLDEYQFYNKLLTDQDRANNHSQWALGVPADTGMGASPEAAIANLNAFQMVLGEDSVNIPEVPAGEYAAWQLSAEILASASNSTNAGALPELNATLVQLFLYADSGGGVVLQESGTAGTAGGAVDFSFDGTLYTEGYIVIQNNEVSAVTLAANVTVA